jgi:hypothetical protein
LPQHLLCLSLFPFSQRHLRLLPQRRNLRR